MFFVSFFLISYHYQNISLTPSVVVGDDVAPESSSSSLVNTESASSLATASQAKSPAAFSLSTLLWPRQMFAETLDASSSSAAAVVESPEDTSSRQDEGEVHQVDRVEKMSESPTVSSASFSGEKSEKRLPQVIIIGVRKCGTRALLEFLNLHSRIQKARDEVHFFDEDSKYALGLEWYRSQMPYSYGNQVTVEKTPAYFVTDAAPERIRAMNSSIRLILLVRDPVTRLISDYAQLNANKLAKKERPLRSIEQMVLLQDGTVNVNYRPVKTSIYSYYYTKWAEVSTVCAHRQHNPSY